MTMPDTTPQAMTPTTAQIEMAQAWAAHHAYHGGTLVSLLARLIAHLESRLATEYERGVKAGEIAQKARDIQFLHDRAFGLRRDASEAGHEERRAMRNTALAYDSAAELMEQNT